MIELDKYEQQVILACKSWGEWNKREGRYKAVRVVISQLYGFDEEELEIDTMYHCLLELYLKVQKYCFNLQYFLENIFKDIPHGGCKKEIDMEHIVRNLISILSEMQVQKDNEVYVELNKDYEILNYGYKEIVTLEDVFDLIIKAEKTDKNGDKFSTDKYGDEDWISKWIQYKRLQNFAFDLDNCKVNISQELADFLTQRYDDLMIEAEEEKGIDLSGDYMMDFNRWVKGIEAPIYW